MKKLYLILLLTLPFQSSANDKLTLILDWFINPDHGPIIIAEENGYFKDVGLEVEIISPAHPADPPKLVAAGKADIAVVGSQSLRVLDERGVPAVRDFLAGLL